MKFLLDTNILIPAEPVSFDGFEASTEIVAALLRNFQDGGHQYYIRKESISEIKKDKDMQRKDARVKLLKKYPILEISQKISSDVSKAYEGKDSNSHDLIDQLMLSALSFDAVDYLVTDDIGIHKKARQINLESRVATSEDALSILSSLFPRQYRQIPALTKTVAYELDEKDPIFSSFRSDYPDFDNWLSKCKREHRTAWIIESESTGLQGVCIVKPEDNCEHQLSLPTLKICSFKVSEDSRGLRYGELLLKGVFDFVSLGKFNSIYLEVFEKQNILIDFLENFGFQKALDKSSKGEVVMVKELVAPKESWLEMEPLAFNIKFGPTLVKSDNTNLFIIPIQPRYHEMLFPEFECQRELFPGKYPFGNGIRKAYLCNSNIRQINPGDIIFFYRSHDVKGITAYGVVEETTISSTPLEIARAVGKRTVYSFEEIQNMCDNSSVLAISFRLSRIIDSAIRFKDLKLNKVVLKAPQSIMSVRHEGVAWLKSFTEKLS
jgi:rRNA maturation endonuclease Nob1